MGKVAILTTAQKEELIGEKYNLVSFFNPLLDLNNNWVISEEEIQNCNQDLKPTWFGDLVLSEFKPKKNTSNLT